LSTHGTEQPSDWVLRWAHLVPEGGAVLDVACGHGRHMRWFAAQGHPATLLLDQAAQAELLVVGHRGLGAVASVCLGSVGLQCVLHAVCPVVVVPPVPRPTVRGATAVASEAQA